MQLRQLEVFYAVMMTGSISAAARMLNITQPGASKIIQQLERRSGFSLFTRAGGRLRPSPEALVLFKETQVLYAQLEKIKALMQNLKRGTGQTVIRVSSTTALAHDVLPIATQDFRSMHSECKAELHTANTKGIFDALMLREIDLGFALNPPEHPAIERKVLATGELVCIAPPGFRHTSKKFRYLDFADHPFIAMHWDDPLAKLFFSECNTAGVELSSAVVVRTYLMARTLVQRGAGLAVIDQYTAQHGGDGSVEIFELEPKLQFSVNALWLKDNEPSLLVKSFIDGFQKAERRVAQNLFRQAPESRRPD
ncbi:MAG TPA: LysR family transcriptional regulator [Burkholderiaceae bacterium]|nr:LysR family transcriptional regulator [Burkholderiaceae bacterium]